MRHRTRPERHRNIAPEVVADVYMRHRTPVGATSQHRQAKDQALYRWYYYYYYYYWYSPPVGGVGDVAMSLG